MLRKFLLLSVCLSWLTACSTINLHFDRQAQLAPYAGTQKAMTSVKRSWHDFAFYGEPVFWAFDVPLCLVADTILLPYDYYRSRRPAVKL